MCMDWFVRTYGRMCVYVCVLAQETAVTLCGILLGVWVAQYIDTQTTGDGGGVQESMWSTHTVQWLVFAVSQVYTVCGGVHG